MKRKVALVTILVAVLIGVAFILKEKSNENLANTNIVEGSINLGTNSDDIEDESTDEKKEDDSNNGSGESDVDDKDDEKNENIDNEGDKDNKDEDDGDEKENDDVDEDNSDTDDDSSKDEEIVDEMEGLNLEERLDKTLKDLDGEYYIGIKDLKTGEDLYINNSSTVVPAASVIKIYIMIEYFNQVDKGTIEESDHYNSLVNRMIQSSNNEATNELIELLTMESINKTIAEMGYGGTILNRKMLDFESRLEGKDNFTCVDDIVNVLHKIYTENCISPEYDEKMLSILKGQNLRNKIPSQIPSSVAIANKTGELPVDSANGFLGVENDVAIVFGEEKEYILCVLANELNSNSSGVSTIQKVSKITFEYFESGKNIYGEEF